MPISPPTHARLLLVVLLAAVLAQGWLALNPGYFSHDELQWGSAARVAHWRELPWMAWTEVATFQWRPLTFNSWLLLSWWLFDHPVAFHLLWVVLGSGLAVALVALLLRLGLAPRPAAVAGLVFALNPYAAFTHGWVATLADLLWVAAGLGLAHALLGLRRRGAGAAAVLSASFVLTAAGLMAKEAALAIPALLGLVWWLSGRDRVLGWATLGSGIAAVLYLGLRLPTLLAPGNDEAYALVPAAAPANALAYPLYLLQPSSFEVVALWNASVSRLVVAGALGLAALVLVARRSPRLAAALGLGGLLVLLPVLPLANASNQYAYGFSAWVIACLALAWPRQGRPGRALWLLLALLSTWHGINVQREMRRAGERQAVFQPALAAVLAERNGPVRLQSPAQDEWLYRRLTHTAFVWDGQAVQGRVIWAAPGEPADFAISENGHLHPSAGSDDLND